MIVRLPGLPVTSTTLPFRATMVGVCDDSMRLPGAIWLGNVPMPPSRSVTPGRQLKSIISVVKKNPRPAAPPPRAVAALQGVGVGHRHAVLVDDREVGGAVPLARQRDVPGQLLARGGVLPVDAPGLLAGVLL